MMTPITPETARERRAIRGLPHGWKSKTSDDLGTLLSALEYDGNWPLAELVELELEQREIEN